MSLCLAGLPTWNHRTQKPTPVKTQAACLRCISYYIISSVMHTFWLVLTCDLLDSFFYFSRFHIAGVMHSTPIQAWVFVWLYFHLHLSSVHYCKDHFHLQSRASLGGHHFLYLHDLNPLTPKIKLVFLLPVYYTILQMLLLRIWYWIY